MKLAIRPVFFSSLRLATLAAVCAACTKVPTNALGGEGGPVTIASGLPGVPVDMVSDGTTVFWTDAVSGNVSSVPAQGGTVTTAVTSVTTGFLAVDAVNLYFRQAGDIFRIPKAGGAPVSISGSGGMVSAATILNGAAYWIEPETGTGSPAGQSAVRTSSVTGGPTTVLAQFDVQALGMAVTATTVFLASPSVQYFPVGQGVPSGQSPPTVGQASCISLVADESAAYCYPESGSILRISANGETTEVFSVSNGHMGAQNLAVDDTYLYALTNSPQGAQVIRVLSRGGDAIAVANEAGNAVAVDDGALYWATADGFVRRLAK